MNLVNLSNSRVKESFGYSCEITKPFGQVDNIISWCKQETSGDWRWTLIDTSSDIRPGRYIFYFDSDKDLCAFTLKWS